MRTFILKRTLWEQFAIVTLVLVFPSVKIVMILKC